MNEHTDSDTKLADFKKEALPHLDALHWFALRLSGNEDQANDLVQDTFLRAFRAWDKYEVGTNCKSWLFTICRNVYLRGQERLKRHDEIVATNIGLGNEGGSPVSPIWASVSEVDPEGEFFKSIVDETVLQAIDNLPEEFRTVVVLADLEDFSYAEIAETMDISIGTVKSRLFRGRRTLQIELYDYAVEVGFLNPSATKETEELVFRGDG